MWLSDNPWLSSLAEGSDLRFTLMLMGRAVKEPLYIADETGHEFATVLGERHYSVE